MRVRNIAIFGAAVLAGALGGSLIGPRPAEAVAREEGEAKEKREQDGAYSTVHVPSRVSSVPMSGTSRPSPAARACAYTSAS